MRITHATVALCLGICVGLAACQRNDTSPRSNDTTPKPATPPGATSSDGVTVLAVGREPRRELRYHLAKGTTSPLELAIDVDMQTGAAAALTGNALPTMVMSGALAVDDVLPNGDMAVRIRLDHATARPRPGSQVSADAFAAQAKRYEGFVETATLSPTGHLRDAHVEIADSSPAVKAQLASMSQSFEQIAVPLPAQAVGPGASWKTSKPVTTNGVTMTVTTTTELTALEGERARYTASTQVSGADQHAQLGGLDLDIHHIVGSGGGGGAIDLATLAVSGTFTTAVHLDVSAADQNEQMGMTMTVAINQPQTL